VNASNDSCPLGHSLSLLALAEELTSALGINEMVFVVGWMTNQQCQGTKG